MLGKLIKYEFKSTSRIMWFLYGGLIIIGSLLGIFLRIQSHVNSSADDVTYYSPLFSMMDTADNPVLRIVVAALIAIYILMIWAVAIMTTILIVTRFYRNLLGGEGYLMHTLPVKTHNLVISKGIVAILWMTIGIIAGIISAIMLGLTSGALQYIFKEMTWDMFKEIINAITSSEFMLFVILAIIGGITSIFTFYMSMAIGNLANKNKFLFSVLAYIGISIVITIIFSIITFAGESMLEMLLDNGSFNMFMIYQIILQTILGIGFFIGTTYILKNKLNLA